MEHGRLVAIDIVGVMVYALILCQLVDPDETQREIACSALANTFLDAATVAKYGQASTYPYTSVCNHHHHRR